MLEYDPEERITAREALKHDFFRTDGAVVSCLENGSDLALDEIIVSEKEPSVSQAQPAEAAVLPKSAKPGSSQVLFMIIRSDYVHACPVSRSCRISIL